MPLFIPHYDLQSLNTLAVPAVADFFVQVTTEGELRDVLGLAKSRQIPVLPLGGGSNIVLTENYSGLVIQLQLRGKTRIKETDEWVWLKVAAGENWHELVEYTLANKLYGLENLSLIPGSVGAAPIQNIGAYGVELKDVFAELSALDVHSGLSVNFTADSCQFEYRNSIFKHASKDKYVITSVTFKLRKQAVMNLSYPALAQAVAHIPVPELTARHVSDAVIALRQAKLPDPKSVPNVGSFFKNPIIHQAHYKSLLETYPRLVSYPVDDQHVKVAAAWLIDQAGWRGRMLNGARVHEHQALVLTNPERLTGHVMLELARAIQVDVYKKFAISLEIEPRVYPA